MDHYETLIQELVKTGYLKTPEIIAAFRKIKREDFVPETLKDEAYLNEPLPIGFGQTISQPLTVAFMLELLQPQKGEKILDIGAGSGWQSALLAEIVGPEGKVYAIERIAELCTFGEGNVKKYNFIESGRAKWECADGSKGLPKHQPFNKIITGAEASEPPSALKEQITIGGKLVIPINGAVWLLVKKSASKFETFKHYGFAFVPLISDDK